MKKGNKKNNILNYFSIEEIIYLIQMVIAYVMLFKIDKISQSIVDSFKVAGSSYDAETIEELTLTYSGHTGQSIIMIVIAMCFIFSLIGFYIYGKKKQTTNKALLITLACISIFFSSSFVSMWYTLLAFVSLILACNIKRKKFTKEEKLEIKKEKEVKVFKAHRTSKLVIKKSLLMILVYVVLMVIPAPKFIRSLNPYVINTIYFIILIVLSISLFSKEYKQMWDAFIKKPGKSFKYILRNYGKLLLVYLPIGFIIVSVFGTSANQESLNSLNAVFVLLSAVIYAPIVEETVFRGAIRKLIKNDIAFVIISGISFGLVHTIGQEVTVLYTLAHAVPYSVIGCYLAYMYTKNGNMMYNMGLHATYNLIACLLAALIGA